MLAEPATSRVAVICVTTPRSIRPPPRSMGFESGVLLELDPTGRLAVFSSADFTWSGDHVGCSCLINAAAPATCGVAMLVPWKKAKHGGEAHEVISILLYTLTPGATTSGLTSLITLFLIMAGPLLEKPARMSALGPSVKNSCGVVPSIDTVWVEAAAIARPLGLETMTAGIVGWFGVPSCAIAVGSPATLL